MHQAVPGSARVGSGPTLARIIVSSESSRQVFAGSPPGLVLAGTNSAVDRGMDYQ